MTARDRVLMVRRVLTSVLVVRAVLLAGTAALVVVSIVDNKDFGMVLGATEYLVKPIDANQLRPALQVAWARFQELHSLTVENMSLKQTLQNRKVIERAKGVLMKRFRWTEAEAFRRLQRGAMNRRMAMVDLAQNVLAGQNVEL